MDPITEAALARTRANITERPWSAPGAAEQFDRMSGVIDDLVETGREDEARSRFGDFEVDRFFRVVEGLDVHTMRCDCSTPDTCELRDKSICAQCGVAHESHPAGDGLTECPGAFGTITTAQAQARTQLQ